MNHLAHGFLAGGDVDFLLGGIAGDFFKGRLERIDDVGLRRGVALHRRIDTFTDGHAVCRRARARFPPALRRYAGIVTDMVFDHFLARHWDRYGTRMSLSRFSAVVYATLRAHEARLPPRFGGLLALMEENDWLVSYTERSSIERAVDRIAARVRGGEVLVGAVAGLGTNYDALECDFHAFFPLLTDFAARERIRLACEIS